jgi:hypothetical protein
MTDSKRPISDVLLKSIRAAHLAGGGNPDDLVIKIYDTIEESVEATVADGFANHGWTFIDRLEADFAPLLPQRDPYAIAYMAAIKRLREKHGPP